MTGLIVVLLAILGLAIGSFLNVVIWRIPRNESVVSPPSHCPGCDGEIRHRDNIPVVSWLLLRGRCRDCGTAISARYPLVESLTAGVFAGVGAAIGPHAELPAFLYLAAIGVALAAIDLDTMKLPNILTIPSYAVSLALLGVAAAVEGDSSRIIRAIEGMGVLYFLYFALCFATSGKGMGFGDVKLAGVLGLYLGWLGWPEVFVGSFLAYLLGGSVGIAMMAFGSAGRKSRIPFGPFLIAGALMAVFVGHPIAHAWLHAA